MRHGQGTRYNTDVHNAVGTIKKYNADQELDEAPYKLGGARAKDWAMSKLGGKMAKGYSKGGPKMMKAMGGKMAKGYSKGTGKGGVKTMTVAQLKAAAKKLGMKVSKA